MKLKKILTALISLSMLTGTIIFPPSTGAADKLPAFPGAEGGGKYTTGARGSSSQTVYHVTNLNDSGAGSLRDAVSKSGRIIVFDVGGAINLTSQLQLSKPNITILGQTAPGDGITVTGNDVLINADNIIIRYIRVRPTDSQGGEPDGMGGRWVHNIVFDHCSLSWSVDETLTLYAGSLEDGTNVSSNITVQYCLTSESMRMSNHFKGAHGYGGIVGGTNATYSHNLFAHHDSRSPRFDRNLKSTDFVNNVIYDWGNTNSMYGAEPYSYNSKEQYSNPSYVSNVNIRNNYFKYGASTKPAIRTRIFDVTNDGSVKYNGSVLKSNLYINGNYVDGSSSVTNNNSYGVNNAANANLIPEPVDMGEYAVEEQTATDAYEDVLKNVGATLPKRDAIDSRVVADVRNGTGRVINTDEEVGSLSSIESASRAFVIPQDWKTAHGMGTASETAKAPSGYTWIEEYANDIASGAAPTNPDITVSYPAVADRNQTYDKKSEGSWLVTDGAVSYSCRAYAKPGTEVTKMELWDGTERIAWYDEESSIDDEFTLAPGTHYLRSRAYNDKGEKTDSAVSNVYVTSGGLNVSEIGKVPFANHSAAWQDGNTTYIAGSGLINVRADRCSFNYNKVKGDFEYTVKIGDIPKYENGVLAGIMYRQTLDDSSRMVMVSDTWYKYGENIVIPVRDKDGGSVSFEWMQDSSGKDIANTSSYDSTDYPLPKYMRISRSGGKLTVSVSNNGSSWTNNARQPYTIDISDWGDEGYIGLACDSANGETMSYQSHTSTIPVLPWYTIASFKDVNAVNVDGVPTPPPVIIPDYDDPNTLPTTKPMSESMTVNISDYALSGSLQEFGSTTLLLDDYLRLYSTSGKTSVIESGYEREFDGVSYPLRLRFGGGGTISNGIPQNRVAEVMPGYDGVVKVHFVNNGKGIRTLALMQAGEDIASKDANEGEAQTLKTNVRGGQRLYLYSKGSALAIHAIEYEAEKPTERPTEQPTEKPTEQPTEKPTEQPTDMPTEQPQSCVMITAHYGEDNVLSDLDIKHMTIDELKEVSVADALTKIFIWYDLEHMVPVREVIE